MNALKGSNLINLKKLNRSKIIQTIYQHAPLSRADIAEITNLTPPTITANISTLIHDGTVQELASSSTQNNKATLGRKPIFIDLIASSRYVIGVEWAFRGISLYLSDLVGNCIGSTFLPSSFINLDEILNTIHLNINDLIQNYHIDRNLILGIGMVVPGFVNSDENMVVYIVHSNLKNVDIASKLSALTGFEVALENNVRGMALAENLFSKKPRPNMFAYYFISGGVACAFMLNNDLICGGISGAGEIGHTIVDPNGPLCNCGNFGCLEALVGAPAIKTRISNILKGNLNTILNELVKDPSNPSVNELVSGACCGDNISISILSDILKYIGISIANMVNLINPKLVILDGEIFSSKYVQTELLSVITSSLFAINATEVDFEFKCYDKQFGAIGGAALAIKNFFIEKE